MSGPDLVERARRPSSARDLSRWAHLTVHEWRPVLSPANLARCTAAYALNATARGAYRTLSGDELGETRTADTVFVFGSGRTLLDIDDESWARIAECQTIAFSEFHRTRFVRIDYHLVNEVHDPAAYAASVAESPQYLETIFVVQKGFVAYRGNELVGRRLLPRGARICRYRRVGRARDRMPSLSLAGGLVHGWNSAFDAVNLALVVGWPRIVVAGVDLHDRGHAYLAPGAHRPQDDPTAVAAPFRGVERTVALFARWRKAAERRGVELCVYDERSALAAALPVFAW